MSMSGQRQRDKGLGRAVMGRVGTKWGLSGCPLTKRCGRLVMYHKQILWKVCSTFYCDIFKRCSVLDSTVLGSIV